METNKLNICFCPSDSTGVAHYRCHTLAKYFERYGLANTRVLFNTFWEWDDFMWADVFVFQRKTDLVEAENFLVEAVRVRNEIKKDHPEYRLPFIYDIDDNLHAIPESNPVFEVYHKNNSEKLRGTEFWIENCDVLMTSTAKLAADYKHLTKGKTVVRRNLIDPEMFEANKAVVRDKSGMIRLLYAGSQTHYDDLKMITPALRKVLNRFSNVELVIFGAGDVNAKNKDKYNFRDLLSGIPRVTYHPFVNTRNYFMRLKSFAPDIGLCPLLNCTFNSAKSAIKFYEYSLAGAAVIASGIGQYPEVVEHDENGLIARSVDDWEKHLITLIKNEGTRRRLQKNADATARIEHGINKQTVHEMYALFQRLHDNEG